MAGNGTIAFSGDNGPATQAGIGFPSRVAVAPDGSLYISDGLARRVRRVGPDGIITTVAGNGGPQSFSGDGGPATEAGFNNVGDIAVGPDGSIYIVDQSRVRRVAPDGIIKTVVGGSTFGLTGDGGPATQATLLPNSLAVDFYGNLYIGGGHIRRVGQDGIIRTVAGNQASGIPVEDGPATQVSFSGTSGIDVDSDGRIYFSFSDRIWRVASSFPGYSIADLLIPSEDGRELYHFDISGRHLRTLNALTGAVHYQFGYDSAGRLTTVTDGSSNVTTIERNAAGTPTGILGPFGQRTALTVDANGFLASVTNPANEAVQLTSTAGGLLTSLTDSRGGIYTFDYDSLGRLAQDTNPAGGFSTLSRTETNSSYTVNLTTAMNRTSTYELQNLLIGTIRRLNTDSSGHQTDEVIGNGTRTITTPDGMITTLVEGPDPRFGMQAPLIKSRNVTTPGGISSTMATTRTTTLANSDPLSLLTQTDTLNINGRTYTSLFNATQRQFTVTSPAGRQSVTQLDTLGRVTNEQVTGIDPLTYNYDALGRLTTISQGIRTSTLTYNSEGFISSVMDPLSRTTGFLYDSAGRMTQQTLPDGRVIGYVYDDNGNITSITPPGRPSHGFAYTSVDLEQTYTPPDLGTGTVATQYTYNLDKQLTQVIRPDGQQITFGYDSGGRLTALTIPGGALQYSYHPTTGNLSTLTAPSGVTLSYTYDGLLLKSTTWAGSVSGSVSRTYDNNFRITSQTVNGANSISFGYDADSLLTSAGSLSISRSAQNGKINGTTLSSVTDSRIYNSFGEISQYTATVSGSPVLEVQYTRDNLGRITQKIETINGVTHTFVYTYDTAGRLTDVTDNGASIAHYNYDANSNRTSLITANGTVSGTYDAQDRMLSYGTDMYTYTANGELQSKTDTALNQTTQYTYDVLGELLSNVVDWVIRRHPFLVFLFPLWFL